MIAEIFLAPAGMGKTGFHTSPTVPGYSADIKEEVFAEFECPSGSFWKGEQGQKMLNDPWRGVAGEQTS